VSSGNTASLDYFFDGSKIQLLQKPKVLSLIYIHYYILQSPAE